MYALFIWNRHRMILACMHAKQLKRKTNKQMLSAQIKKNAISLVSCVQIFFKFFHIILRLPIIKMQHMTNICLFSIRANWDTLRSRTKVWKSKTITWSTSGPNLHDEILDPEQPKMLILTPHCPISIVRSSPKLRFINKPCSD